MPFTGDQLIQISLERARRQDDDARQDLYQRLSDHYHDTLASETYFPKGYAESQERYDKRPKESLGLCPSALEVLAGATVGDGVEVTIEHGGSNSTYQEIATSNDLHGAHSLTLSTMAGAFGWCVDRIVPTEIPVSPDLVEFEAVNPGTFIPFYNEAALGRSKKVLRGVTFVTVYDMEAGAILPRDTRTDQPNRDIRTEIITDEIWHVYLGTTLTPVDPMTGDRWMPTDDGDNPFGVVPVVPLWNVNQLGAFEGKSDIDPAYKRAEQVNRNYSQILYNIDHYFPTLVLPGEAGVDSPITRGIGRGIAADKDFADGVHYITPTFDVNVLLDPLKVQLNLFFSQAHTPASSHGLGAVFGEAKAAESGRAKFYEFNRLAGYVKKKRKNFEKHVKDKYRALAQMSASPMWRGAKLQEDAGVAVEWASPIVPVSDEEALETIIAEMQAGLLTHLEADMKRRGIENPDEAQKIVDDIGKQKGRVQTVDRFDQELEDELAQ